MICLSDEERTQIKPKRKGKKATTNTRQLDLFSQPAQNPIILKPIEKPTVLPIEPRPYEGALNDSHKQGSLVVDKEQVGFLKERYREDAVFMPLELNPIQKAKAEQYIQSAIHTNYCMLTKQRN
ncbi:hypothetical protein FACS1894181_06610 [Bacteroidia bacterium]|nr:hypothetical protein FACS1894181_06610 [Bacteroidia bacterium]